MQHAFLKMFILYNVDQIKSNENKKSDFKTNKWAESNKC
jgi:hypothetical protein